MEEKPGTTFLAIFFPVWFWLELVYESFSGQI